MPRSDFLPLATARPRPTLREINERLVVRLTAPGNEPAWEQLTEVVVVLMETMRMEGHK